jgi:glycosyltransferase involved in cell wall biosynthesis
VTGFGGLRIGLVGPLPPPAGGMANQTHQLAELLGNEGATVVPVQSNAPYRPAFIGRVPVVRAAFRLLPYLVALWRAAGRCDVFHVMANSGWSWTLFAVPAIRIARLRGVPVVVNYRGGEAETFLERAHERVRRTLNQCAVLAVPSGFLQTVFGRYGIRAEILPNIVDLSRFHPAEQGRQRGAHLIVARNLEPIYDNATAIHALALVRQVRGDARLTITGTGPEEPWLRRLAVELDLGDFVRFAGRLDRDAMARLYREADIALNPSTVDNMPNSVLEALASGVPVVSTNVGGVPYIVQDGTSALLVPPRDPQAMATAVLRLLDNSHMVESMVTAGRSQVPRYAWERVSGVLADIYGRSLAMRAGR